MRLPADSTHNCAAKRDGPEDARSPFCLFAVHCRDVTAERWRLKD
jgi:hypothetical protein